jgi:hypothetical protein
MQTQINCVTRPNYEGVIGDSLQRATDASNYFTRTYKIYCCAIPNPNPQWSLVQGKSWVVSNCYHPFK